MEIDRERVNGLLRGVLGGVAGLVAMRLFFEAMEALPLTSEDSEDAANASSEDSIESTDALDDIAVGGMKSRDEEPATATMGRLAHEAVTGREPEEDRKAKLGQAVHWGYGILMGGAYGATRTHSDGPDLVGGLGFGTALWALGDELAVPLLGLAEGPTAHGWSDHASALGAHLAYGAATATTANALKRIM